ncbi:YagK/YfjJ domain-containing protein [Serratia liquefaciens]|uniref:YagK/YfjJ domain-containing protein n=1 Tax=Serratia liquefaciens TaxID=614 RepID=UPI003CFCBF0B|nr:inovirus-type Gp2 protein [Serratia liquefaciens]
MTSITAPTWMGHVLLSCQLHDDGIADAVVVNRDYINVEALITQTQYIIALGTTTTLIPPVGSPPGPLDDFTASLLQVLTFHYRNAEVYACRTLHPTVVAFHDMADQLLPSTSFDPAAILEGLHPLPVMAVNNVLQRFRWVVNTPEHSQRLTKFRRAALKNTHSSERYISRLFERYAKLLVVRIDLSYGVLAKQGITAQQARADRERLFRNIKANRLFQHCVGYIWKLEYGHEKRYHYHMFFFFNGSRVREDVTLGRLIGEYWNRKITEGKGCYYNCNANKACYAMLGIGMVRWNDTALRQGLLRAVSYLTKTDEWIRLTLPEQGRSFGRGVLAPPPETLRGRPRYFEDQ